MINGPLRHCHITLPLALATKLFPVAFSGCFFTNNTPTYILTEGPFGDKITGERVAFFRC